MSFDQSTALIPTDVVVDNLPIVVVLVAAAIIGFLFWVEHHFPPRTNRAGPIVLSKGAQGSRYSATDNLAAFDQDYWDDAFRDDYWDNTSTTGDRKLSKRHLGTHAGKAQG